MRVRSFVLAFVALLATATFAAAQSQTGEIFGKATDSSGAVLPGVTVTLSGPSLLQPLTAVTSGSGTYQFPRIEIGTYTVKFELTGFKTVVNEGIKVTVGFSAQINAQLGVSTVQETVTVTGQSPIVDTKETGTKQTFTNELLQSIPSARDPWVILQQTAGVAMDRENVGGNMSGQQSNYVSRGGNPFNNKWSLDGVDITDMSATGASPSYYDFDAFEEMTINTGGVDVTQQTGGVGINLVTKSGTDRFKGSSRFYDTNKAVESNNLTDAQRTQGASSGNPIQDIKDYGIELGGPIKKGKAWAWGSYGKQNIGVGVLNFYQPTSGCLGIKADEAANALAHSVEDVNNCLNTDLTVLQTTNLKTEVQLFSGNKLSVFANLAKKDRNARGADDLHPIETTTPQGAVPSTYGFGKSYWSIGPNPTYKAGDQWVLSDRLLLDVQWAHIGNNFILDFHDPSLTTVQPSLIIATSLNGRSATQSINIRPVQSVDLNMNYFIPATIGGDHALKVGGHWRDANGFNQGHTGGNVIDRFPTSINDNCAALAAANPTKLTSWCQAQFTRDSQTDYDLLNWSAYAQDTITHNRLTMQLGVRYDYNHDKALASSVSANPLLPQWLPAINFAGADPGVAFNDFSPRLGLTYDMQGNGKTVARANYARYYGQVGTGGVSFQVNPVTSANVRFPWNDANGDKIVQVNEVQASLANVLSFGGNYDPANPGLLGTANTVDPNLKNDRTDEFIVGVDHEIGAGFAAGVNYIWRRYSGFQFADTVGLDPSDYSAVAFTPAATACPAGASCPQVTYYQPNFLIPGVSNLTNFTSSQYNRTFNGVEATARKRMSHHWLMNTSFAYNSTVVNMNGFAGDAANGLQVTGVPEDPTNRSQRNGAQYDYATSGSGIGNVFINAKWLFKLSGLYQLPADFNVSAFYNARQGYPFERFVQTPSRANGAGVASVFIDNVGDSRLPNYQNLDFHLERPIKIGTTRWIPALDIFNVMNSNTVQAIRGTQNASNANNIQAILAPRVMRVGIRVNW
jgi:hypothetical protein